MSAGCKKTKADLTALFRLEFYRNKNNWKFCNQIHPKDKRGASKDKAKTSKTKSEDKPKEVQNRTYDVESQEEGDQSLLNEAFVDTDNDKNNSTSRDSPTPPTKDCTPTFVTTLGKCSPDSQDQTKQPCSDKLENFEQNTTKPNSNSTEIYGQNWTEYENLNQCDKSQVDQNWPYMIHNQNWPIIYENVPQEKFYQNIPEMKSKEDWLQLDLTKYEGYQNYQQNWPENLQNWPQSLQNVHQTETKIMQTWANIAVTQNKLENDTDWPKLDKVAEPIFENWHNWKETQILSETCQNLHEICQNDIVCGNCQRKVLPEINKKGYEGSEGAWPWQSDVFTNNKHLSEAIWSEDVLRELEILNAHDLATELPSVGEKWVPPDRLLQWMMANKECCEDLLEESSCSSEEAFIRAAHCAPHSSEAHVQPSAPESPVATVTLDPSEAVSTLSETALRAAGRAHAHALRRVAHELRTRERIKDDMQRSRSTGHSTMPTPRYDISGEEYPTRDIGLHQPIFLDTFIAGSYKNNPNDKHLDTHFDKWGSDGPMHLEGGRIVLNKGRMKPERGQTEPDRGKTEPERGKTVLERGKTVPERCQMGQLRVVDDQIVIDRDEMNLDILECEIREKSGLGDVNFIGRGRGRLLLGNKNDFGMGRGRGRI